MKNDVTVHDQTAKIVKQVENNSHARLMLDRFLVTMAKRGFKYKDHEKELMKLTFHLWMMETQTGSPIAIALPPSFGKSTALVEYALYMTEHAPFFGAVVVKDTREQVREYISEVNERAGHMVAFPLLGKTDVITVEEHKSNLNESQFFPILCMTKAMFQARSAMKDIERFAFWTNKQDKTRHRRAVLILDEPPVFETTAEFTAKKLTGFLETVRQLSYRANGKQESYYKEVRQKAMFLRELIEDADTPAGFVEAIDSSFYLPEKLKKDWAYNYTGEEGNLLAVFEVMVRDGAYKTINPKKCSLTASYKTYLDWTAFNPFILDGTAHVDKTYEALNFPILSLEEEEGKYSHVNFKVFSTGGTFSKTSISDTKNSLDITTKLVKELSKPYELTMVVCHSDFYEELAEKLYMEIVSQKIKLKYFDNGRSSNEYDKCDSAIFIGELDKGEAVHHSIARLRYGNDIKTGFNANRHGKHYADPRVKEIAVNDSAIQRIQEIHRLRARNRKLKLDIFLIGKNDELVQEVVSNFDGATCEEILPKSEGLRKVDSKYRFMKWLKEFEESAEQEVKAKDIYSEELGMKPRTWTDVKKDPDVHALMHELEIHFKGHNIVKG